MALSSINHWAEAFKRFCITVGGVAAAVSVFVQLNQFSQILSRQCCLASISHPNLSPVYWTPITAYKLPSQSLTFRIWLRFCADIWTKSRRLAALIQRVLWLLPATENRLKKGSWTKKEKPNGNCGITKRKKPKTGHSSVGNPPKERRGDGVGQSKHLKSHKDTMRS